MKLQADGSITIEVRHSSEAPPPVVDKAKSLHLAVVEQRQQQWAAAAAARSVANFVTL